jgi:glutathione reductase (NADPH)
MWNAVNIAEALHDAKDYGFTAKNEGFNWLHVKQQRDAYISRLNDTYGNLLKNSNVESVRGWAKFVGKNTIQVCVTMLIFPLLCDNRTPYC